MMKASYSFTILFIAVALLLAGCSEYSGLTDEELGNRLSKELPEGSNASTILSFLDEKHIKHTGVTNVPAEILGGSQEDPFFSDRKLEGKRARVRKVIDAEVSSDYSSSIGWNNIKFYMDDENRLVGIVVIRSAVSIVSPL